MRLQVLLLLLLGTRTTIALPRHATPDATLLFLEARVQLNQQGTRASRKCLWDLVRKTRAPGPARAEHLTVFAVPCALEVPSGFPRLRRPRRLGGNRRH